MANKTKFLPAVSYNHIEGKEIVAANCIDFSEENAANGDTVEALHIPKGAIVTDAGLVVHTTQTLVTIELGDEDSGVQFLTSQTLTDLKANAAAVEGAAVGDAGKKFYPAKNKLILTIGGADADVAKVTVFVKYFIIPATAVA